MRAGPLEVVRLFARWDTAGKRLSRGAEPQYDQALDSLKCFLPDEDCSSDEIGYDRAYLVRGYEIVPVVQAADSAVVEVRWAVAAEATSDLTIRENRRVVPHRMKLRAIRSQWRFVGEENQTPPHPSLRLGLNFAGSAADSALVSRLIRQVR